MNAGSVQLCVAWQVRPQQAVAVGAAAQSVMCASHRERGCLTCSLATEVDDQVTLTLIEVWDSEASLQRHLASPLFEALAGLLESSVVPPRVEFTLGDGVRGVEYAIRVREGTRRGTSDR